MKNSKRSKERSLHERLGARALVPAILIAAGSFSLLFTSCPQALPEPEALGQDITIKPVAANAYELSWTRDSNAANGYGVYQKLTTQKTVAGHTPQISTTYSYWGVPQTEEGATNVKHEVSGLKIQEKVDDDTTIEYLSYEYAVLVTERDYNMAAAVNKISGWKKADPLSSMQPDITITSLNTAYRITWTHTQSDTDTFYTLYRKVLVRTLVGGNPLSVNGKVLDDVYEIEAIPVTIAAGNGGGSYDDKVRDALDKRNEEGKADNTKYEYKEILYALLKDAKDFDETQANVLLTAGKWKNAEDYNKNPGKITVSVTPTSNSFIINWSDKPETGDTTTYTLYRKYTVTTTVNGQEGTSVENIAVIPLTLKACVDGTYTDKVKAEEDAKNKDGESSKTTVKYGDKFFYYLLKNAPGFDMSNTGALDIQWSTAEEKQYDNNYTTLSPNDLSYKNASAVYPLPPAPMVIAATLRDANEDVINTGDAWGTSPSAYIENSSITIGGLQAPYTYTFNIYATSDVRFDAGQASRVLLLSETVTPGYDNGHYTVGYDNSNRNNLSERDSELSLNFDSKVSDIEGWAEWSRNADVTIYLEVEYGIIDFCKMTLAEFSGSRTRTESLALPLKTFAKTSTPISNTDVASSPTVGVKGKKLL